MSKEVRHFKGTLLRADEVINGGSEIPQLRLSGYAAKFNSSTMINKGTSNQFRERIASTAFARALRENADVRMLRNHDPNFVLGRTKSGTLRLSTDNVGLFFECLLPQTQDARDLHTVIKRGDMDQCSFAFKAPDGGDSWSEEFDEDSRQTIPLRTLRDVDLFDVSAVTYPAYEDTSVSARGAAVVAGNGRVIPANDWRALDEQVLMLRHAINQKKIWQDDECAHEERMEERMERAKLLPEYFSLYNKIHFRRFPTVEAHMVAARRLQEVQAELRSGGASAYPIDFQIGDFVKLYECSGILKVIARVGDVTTAEDVQGTWFTFDAAAVSKVMTGGFEKQPQVVNLVKSV
jgi:HK97 family phage prohead protease